MLSAARYHVRWEMVAEAMDAYISKALVKATVYRNNRLVSKCLTLLSSIYNMLEDYDEALHYAERALNISISTGDTRHTSFAHIFLGEIYERMDSLALSKKHYQQGLYIRKRLQDPRAIARSHIILGNLLNRMEKSDSAAFHCPSSLVETMHFQCKSFQLLPTFGYFWLKRPNEAQSLQFS